MKSPLPPRYELTFMGRKVVSPTPSFLFGTYYQKHPFGMIVWVEQGSVAQRAEYLTFEEIGQLAGGN